jgi:hypothetical protein
MTDDEDDSFPDARSDIDGWGEMALLGASPKILFELSLEFHTAMSLFDSGGVRNAEAVVELPNPSSPEVRRVARRFLLSEADLVEHAIHLLMQNADDFNRIRCYLCQARPMKELRLVLIGRADEIHDQQVLIDVLSGVETEMIP